MRFIKGLIGLSLLAGAAVPAEAARIFILTDPMTLERRTMVVEHPGPDRFYLCAMPPATSGCREITPRVR